MKRGKANFIIGIDEAGRGPLAGPIVVGGVKIATSDKKQATRIFRGIRDSKKLTPKKREEWFRKLTAHPRIEWAAAKISPKVIDRVNIAQAANLGAFRVYRKLSVNGESLTNQRVNELRIRNSFIRKFAGNSLFVDKVLLDGSLYLPGHISHQTVIKGDEKIPVIAAASIIAKVTRDRLMRRLHKKFPQYGFEKHKGYSTRLHRDMLKTYGISAIHRLSFCKRF